MNFCYLQANFSILLDNLRTLIIINVFKLLDKLHIHTHTQKIIFIPFFCCYSREMDIRLNCYFDFNMRKEVSTLISESFTVSSLIIKLNETVAYTGSP